MTVDLDTLLNALQVKLIDRIYPLARVHPGPGQRPEVTDAELVCIALSLNDQPTNRPVSGTAFVTDKGLAGEETKTPWQVTSR